MAAPFIKTITEDARVLVELEGRPLERYAIMLQIRFEGRWQTIRLLDNAHGDHDMHRSTLAQRSSRQSGSPKVRSTRSRRWPSAT